MKRSQPKKLLTLQPELVRVLDAVKLQSVGGGGFTVAKGAPACASGTDCNTQ